MGQVVFRNPDGFMNITQGVFGDKFVSVFAKEKSNGGPIPLPSQLTIHRLYIKIKLARIGRFKIARFELNHHVTMQTRVIQEQINEIFL